MSLGPVKLIGSGGASLRPSNPFSREEGAPRPPRAQKQQRTIDSVESKARNGRPSRVDAGSAQIFGPRSVSIHVTCPAISRGPPGGAEAGPNALIASAAMRIRQEACGDSAQRRADTAKRAFLHANRTSGQSAHLGDEAGAVFAQIADALRGTSSEELDRELAEEFPLRAELYNSVDWTLERRSHTDLQVWPGMNDLPIDATMNSPADVVACLRGRGIPAGSKLEGFLDRWKERPEETVAFARAMPLLAITGQDWHKEAILHSMPKDFVETVEAHRRLIQNSDRLQLDDGNNRAVFLALVAPHDPVDVLVGRTKSMPTKEPR